MYTLIYISIRDYHTSSHIPAMRVFIFEIFLFHLSYLRFFLHTRTHTYIRIHIRTEEYSACVQYDKNNYTLSIDNDVNISTANESYTLPPSSTSTSL